MGRKPSDILRQIHPEQFSDSEINEKISFSKNLLEFTLSHLSEKNKCFNFEEFAKRLLEREICPNLIEETGPAAGGDGKVDTENYPVAEILQEFWLFGLNKDNEKWAFAVSLKKKWKEKCNSDIEKILKTKREYKKFFFITNQLIKNDIRLRYQDEKTKEAGMEIILFDRTWIVDKVSKPENQDILPIIGFNEKISEKIVGKNDYKKIKRKEEIEAKLNKYSQKGVVNQDVIDLAIESAILSRNLEYDKDQVFGEFDRALRFARRRNNINAEKEIIYNICWYSFWWLNDEIIAKEYYEKYEDFVKTNKIIDDIEKLFNLWILLFSKYKNEIEIEKTNILLGLINEKTNSKSKVVCLQSKCIFCLIKIVLEENEDEQFETLKKIIEESSKYKEINVVSYIRIIEKMLPKYVDNKKYLELYDLCAETLTIRKGDIEKANMYLQKGKMMAQKNCHYEVIKILGKSLNLFYKEETSDKLIENYINIGAQYQSIGLEYSAKNYYISAISMFINDLLKDNILDKITLKILQQIINIEAKHGNVERIINWVEIYNIFINILQDKNESIDDEDKQYLMYCDSLLSMMILKTGKRNFENLQKIIKKCEKCDLLLSEVSAKYAIGIYDEKLIEEYKDKQKVDELMYDLYNNSLKNGIFEPIYIDNQDVEIKSLLMGFEIKIHMKNTRLCHKFGEYLLALLENTFATMYSHNVIMKNDINIKLNEFEGEFNFDFMYDGIDTYHINLVGIDDCDISSEQHKIISNKSFEFLSNILARNFMYSNFEKTIKDLFEDEKCFERAMNHTNIIYTLNNIFGIDEEMDNSFFEIKRTEEWYKKLGLKETNATDKMIDICELQKEALWDGKKFFSIDNIRHDNIFVSKMIVCPHWDLAKWKGMIIITDNIYNKFIRIGFLFESKEGAKLVFEDLIKCATKNDIDGKILISFIKGIDKDNCFDYRVMITERLKISKEKEYGLIQPIVRFHNMNCKNDFNIKRMEQSLNMNENCEISIFPSVVEGDKIKLMSDYEIKVKNINIKDAYNIGFNDIESMVIMPDDKPLIPQEIADPPIIELLKLKKEKIVRY